MTTWPIVGDGKSIRPSHITTLQDAIDGVQDGTNPIALAGIEDALGAYGPLTNLRYAEYNVLDYGAIPGAVSSGQRTLNTVAIQAAADAAENLVRLPDDPGVEPEDQVAATPGRFRLF